MPRQTSANGFRIRWMNADLERLDRIKEKWGCTTDAQAVRQALVLADRFSNGDIILSLPPEKKSKKSSKSS
jgi:hypothetical protein